MRKILYFLIWLIASPAMAQGDPLPSWNDTAAKTSIIAFVTDTTTQGHEKYVKPAERIAVFDNDGTLWAEQPMYFQVQFALDQVKKMAPEHPEWKEKQPFKAVLENDSNSLAATGEKGLLEIIEATHSGITVAKLHENVTQWLRTAKHPRFNRLYTSLVYQPMLELLCYLRANGYKTYIVSGGGVEFMRAFTEEVYGIPPEQVIGSSEATKYIMNENREPELEKQAKLEILDDGPGKPESINRVIGRRPVIAFGNSDGDLQMLQWTTSGKGARFAGLIHHTDADREWAYDRHSLVGKLDRALNEAPSWGWRVVDMKTEWKVIFPPK